MLLVIRERVAAEIVAVYVQPWPFSARQKMGQMYVIGTVSVQTDTQTYRNRLCPECRLGLPTDLYGGSLMLAPNYDEHAHLPTDGINSIGRQHCRDGDGGGGVW